MQKLIKLSDYGYNVEKMALKTFLFPENLFQEMKKCSQNDYLLQEQFGLDNTTKYREVLGYIEGFKAHQELTKDKLFTKEDMINSLKELSYQLFLKKEFSLSESIEKSSKIIQSLHPKTEWPVEFDEQGKLKLV